MAGKVFSAQIEAWVERVKEAEAAIFKEAAQEIVVQLNEQIAEMIYDTPETPNYRRTGFLRSSLVASKDAMPQMIRDNPGVQVPDTGIGDIVLVINGAELGDTIYLGYTARYGFFVHSGTTRMAPRPWVDLVAQRWPAIIAAKEAEVKQKFGL